MGKLEGFIAIEFNFVSDYEFGLVDVFGSQELLGSGARRSTFAVVIPIDWLTHRGSVLVCCEVEPSTSDRCMDSLEQGWCGRCCCCLGSHG